MTTAQKVYPPADDTELAAAFKYARGHRTYGRLLPPKKTLYIDWFLLRAIFNEVEKRRTSTVKLALLVGTVVREFVPDVNRKTRDLGIAYRNLVMYMFRRRKDLQGAQRKRRAKAREHPPDAGDQLRMI